MKDHKFNFDKFVNDIDKRESEGRLRMKEHLEGYEKTPQRKYNELYREHWQNSTRFRSKK
jgi:hypothetical protein